MKGALGIMKINPQWRPLGKEIKKPEHAPPHPARTGEFADMMKQQDEQASREQLKRLLKQIDGQADRLSKSMTVRELRNYRWMVKQFLEATVRLGVGIEHTKGWDRRGRGKRYKLLKEIDRQLLDMAEEMLESEHGRIGILHRIGEIRGLLINLSF